MEDFRRIVNLLKKCFPEYKVSVRRVPVSKDTAGECFLINNRKKRQEFLIKIDPKLDEETAIMILIHEWSHINSWSKPGSDHGPEWGKAYSRIYRLYLKNWIEKTI